jgi:2-polyprenyl-3-methyl-5-hydroxy-6-metoxy-1,4-benzoquinol methylase
VDDRGLIIARDLNVLERFDPTRASENPCYRAFASYQTGLYERAREAIRGLGQPHVRVLDAACGVGYGSTYLADLGAYEGLDADPGTVERARARWPGATYSVADLEDPRTFAGRGELDAITSFETAEHLRVPGKFLRNCRGALRPGGMFCFSVPTCRTKDFDPYHRHDWPANRWEEMLCAAGFEIMAKHDHQIDETFESFRTMIPVPAWQHVWAGWRAVRLGYGAARIREWLIEGRFRCRWTMWVCARG